MHKIYSWLLNFKFKAKHFRKLPLISIELTNSRQRILKQTHTPEMEDRFLYFTHVLYQARSENVTKATVFNIPKISTIESGLYQTATSWTLG